MGTADPAVQSLRKQGLFWAFVEIFQHVGRFVLFVLTGKEDPPDSEPLDPRYVAYYEQHIRAQVEDFEVRRQQVARILRRRGPWVIAAYVVVLLCFFQLPIDLVAYPVLVPVICIFMLFPTLPWLSGDLTRYHDSIKQQIFPHVVQFFGPEWSYSPKGTRGTGGKSKRPLSSDWMQFDILPEHDKVEAQDAVQGTYKDIALQQLECKLISYNSKREKAFDFVGILVQIEVPKRFIGYTMVLREQQGRINKSLQKRGMRNYISVKLEDPRFEVRYEVFATDAVEARYLLTPSFMERLIALETQFEQTYKEACPLQCAFKNGKLLLVLPCGYDGFDTGSIYRPVNFHHEINRVLREMDQLFAIVDVLKLDDRTGL